VIKLELTFRDGLYATNPCKILYKDDDDQLIQLTKFRCTRTGDVALHACQFKSMLCDAAYRLKIMRVRAAIKKDLHLQQAFTPIQYVELDTHKFYGQRNTVGQRFIFLNEHMFVSDAKLDIELKLFDRSPFTLGMFRDCLMFGQELGLGGLRIREEGKFDAVITDISEV